MMKMKIRVMSLVALLGFACNAGASEISLRVVDERGEPMVGVSSLISFAHPQQKDKGYRGKTDNEGRFSAKGRNLVGIIAKVEEEGYYKWVKDDYYGQQDHDITVVMRKIGKPIPLYVRKVNLEFPVFDKWLGFDFEVGDWVAPQGKGKSRDILFKLNREFQGYRFSKEKMEKMKFPDSTEEDLKKAYGKWKSELQVGFSSDLEGVVEEKDGYLPYSKMKMPHLAPDGGYRSEEIVIKKKSFKSREEQDEEIRNHAKFGEGKPSGYFIRTRVVEVGGKVVKANYAKMPKNEVWREVNTPVSIDASGSIEFTYYFNPTPNDRNLEYRPGSNLATEQKRQYDP